MLGLQQELSTAIAEQVRLRLSPERLDALARRQTRNADAYDLYLRGPELLRTSARHRRRSRAIEYFRARDRARPELRARVVRHRQGPGASPINGDVAPLQIGARVREAATRRSRRPEPRRGAACPGSSQLVPRVGLAGGRGGVPAGDHPRSELRHGPHRSSATCSRKGAGTTRRSLSMRADASWIRSTRWAMRCPRRSRSRPATTPRPSSMRGRPSSWTRVLDRPHDARTGGGADSARPDLALEALRMRPVSRAGNSKAMSLRGYVLARLGRAAEARDILTTLETAFRERYVPPYALALVHAGLGEREAVFDSLEGPTRRTTSISSLCPSIPDGTRTGPIPGSGRSSSAAASRARRAAPSTQ